MSVQDAEEPETDLLRRGPAFVAMFASGILFGVMALGARMTSRHGAAWVPAAEVTFARHLFGAVAMLPLLAVPRARLLGHDRVGLLWRGLSGGVAVYLYFVALHHTTLTHAVLLNLSSVVFGPIFSAILLKERINRRTAIAITVASVGIVLITRPEAHGSVMGDLYALASGILAGSAITAVRRLRQNETAASVFFYFSIIGMPIAVLGFGTQRPIWPQPAGLWLLALICVSSLFAQLLMTYGYRFIRTAEGVVVTLSQVVFTAVMGVLLLHEPLCGATLLGGALILGSALWLSFTARPAPARG